MAQTTYITKPGDRWDSIAYAAYGDALKITTLTDANPTVPLSAEIAENTTLNIPILEPSDISSDNLPPWKR